ncbi:MAG: biotin synthase BioB [Elusimicrobia bacterium]|nr:biotin synthase BioB [Elusimicrobiota bacterium]
MKKINKSEINLLLDLPLPELISRANEVRKRGVGNNLELCSIMNAKSGLCSEDCKFCAQSAHHSTDISVYPLKNKKEMLVAAQQAKDIGAGRFDIVSSGNTLSNDEVSIIAEAIVEIRKKIGIDMCASLGKLNEENLLLLKNAGLSRYHHNIETSRNYFPNIVSTHSFQDRIDTIKTAKKVGLQVCSGGIIGIGETWSDRIDMVLTLKELNVDSVPINVLVPIKGTNMESQKSLSCVDAIKTIAIFRIVLQDKIIKIAAGRESVLKDFQAMAFMAGANGMLIGGYLTIKGRNVKDDRQLVEEIKKVWCE